MNNYDSNMTQFIRLFIFSFFVFFGVNLFAQSNNFKLEKTSPKLKNAENKNLIFVEPTSIIKQKKQQVKYPKKPKKEPKHTEQRGQKPTKPKQAIIDEKNNPK
ncbi:MAG TPA: hypothetical protein DGM69_03590 [Chloroflexi bacterium]|nr:hypothetical protein [Chloroflexota bacterium]